MRVLGCHAPSDRARAAITPRMWQWADGNATASISQIFKPQPGVYFTWPRNRENGSRRGESDDETAYRKGTARPAALALECTKSCRITVSQFETATTHYIF